MAAICDDSTRCDIEETLIRCFGVIGLYEKLIDSFVLDFFVERHWNRIPKSWQQTLEEMRPKEMAEWLNYDGDSNRLLPLSLLALKATLKTYSIRRSPVKGPDDLSRMLNLNFDQEDFEWKSFSDEFRGGVQHKNLEHVFRKHVKAKKQHEIVRLAKVVDVLAKASQCDRVLDVGSGVGHLARLMGHKHGLGITCVDTQSDFSASAKKFDADLAKNYSNSGLSPKHLTFRLEPEMDPTLLEDALKLDEAGFGIVGLHTCGDLAPIAIRLFAESSKAKFIASVGCCYMKAEKMFPMSEFLQDRDLSFVARELSCHAIESYVERLTQDADNKLKVHCQRATLERMLNAKDPKLRHSCLKAVKRSHELDFEEYARKATQNINITWSDADFEDEETLKNLSDWWKVVAFYSLRLAFAPIIETAVLLDRMLYLKEKGFDSVLVPIFDPIVSPRNHVLISLKQ